MRHIPIRNIYVYSLRNSIKSDDPQKKSDKENLPLVKVQGKISREIALVFFPFKKSLID